MPTVASTPRSLGGGRQVGRVSSTPRSASGGYSITGGRWVTGGRTVGRPRTGEEAILGIEGATPSGRGRTPLTPLRFALRTSNVPGLAIGEAIRDPRTLVNGRSAIDLFRDEKAVGIGDALRGCGVIPGGKPGSRSASLPTSSSTRPRT